QFSMVFRRILFSLLLLSSSLLYAQEYTGGFSLRAGYEYSTLQAFDLNDFFQNYNAFYGSEMAQPFDTIAATEISHPELGAGFRIAHGENIGFTSGIFATYGSKRLQRTAEFQNGIGTQADLVVRDLNLQIDLGIHIKQVLFLQGHLSGRFRRNFLDLGYVYQDGSYSLGDENDVLGVYSAETTTLDFGASVGVKLGPVFIPVSISFPSEFVSDDGMLSMVDVDNRQAGWTDLPRDFATWVNDPANVDLDNGLVRANSFQSMRINVAVEFLFGSPTLKGK
ncbi:MAG: hypothetical protein AAF206_10255, partial [Bacteroidota bacterium]